MKIQVKKEEDKNKVKNKLTKSSQVKWADSEEIENGQQVTVTTILSILSLFTSLPL